MAAAIDLTGRKFDRLKVIRKTKSNKGQWWLCKCSCGEEIEYRGKILTAGEATSCGCKKAELNRTRSITHGRSRNSDRTYITWSNMIQRCTNEKHPFYINYGYRGVKVCKRWFKFKNFLEDMGNSPPNKSLDRKNNNSNYSKKNCRWATSKEQNNNKRNNHFITYKGKTLTISQWEQETGTNRSTIRYRLSKGWTTKELFIESPLADNTLHLLCNGLALWYWQ